MQHLLGCRGPIGCRAKGDYPSRPAARTAHYRPLVRDFRPRGGYRDRLGVELLFGTAGLCLVPVAARCSHPSYSTRPPPLRAKSLPPRLPAFFRRLPETLAPAPVPEKTIAERAAEVIEHHRLYWAALGSNVLMNAMSVLVIVGVPYAIFQSTRFALIRTHGAELPDFRFDLSGSSALAAFAVLATLVVALQVSVRAPMPTDDVPAAEARQISLEALARLCGASAIAVGAAAAFAQLPTPGTLDSMRFLGPIAGAILLALFAGDAASASNARLGEAMTELRAKIASDRLIAALDKIDRETRSPGWAGYVLQSAAGVLALPVLLSFGYFLLWTDNAPEVWFVFAAAALFAGLQALAIGLIVTIRNLWVRRDRLLAAYWACLFGACFLAVTAFAYAFQPPPVPSDARSLLGRLAVTAVVVAIWTISSVALATRLPWSRWRGPGSGILAALLRFSIRKSTRTILPSESGLPARLWVIVATSVALPPVGLFWAVRHGEGAEAGVNPRHRKVRLAALWIGSGGSIAWITAVIVLIAVNPRF